MGASRSFAVPFGPSERIEGEHPMTSLKLLNGPSADARTIVLFAGGPGLSSGTLQSLEQLTDWFNVVLVDLPGTGESSQATELEYQQILVSAENALTELNLEIVLVGHSFGGILAADLVLRGKLKVSALICIASPFSVSAYRKIEENYLRLRTEQTRQTENKFLESPIDENFKRWVASYGSLYFSKEVNVGAKLLLEDRSSATAFRTAQAKSTERGVILDELRSTLVKRAFLAGTDDLLVDLETARSEAVSGDFEFIKIQSAGHFTFVDEPEQTRRAIFEFLTKGQV